MSEIEKHYTRLIAELGLTMQKLETRNGTLLFIRVQEKYNSLEFNKEHKSSGKYELLGEVTKDVITFDCAPFVEEVTIGYDEDSFPIIGYKNGAMPYQTCETASEAFMTKCKSQGIELTEGKKFIVLKEK